MLINLPCFVVLWYSLLAGIMVPSDLMVFNVQWAPGTPLLTDKSDL